MPTTIQVLEKPDLKVSRLSRVMSKLSLKTEERKGPKSPKGLAFDAQNDSWNIPIPAGISRSRMRDYMHSTFIASNGRPFLPQYSEIISKRLFISDRYTGTEPAVLSKLGITHVVCIVNSSTQICRPLVGVRYHDMVVSPEAYKVCCLLAQVDDTVDFIDNALRKNGTRVLIHCDTGVSWSPGVAIAWLMRSESCTYEVAEELVKRKRDVARPSLEIEKGVREWWALEMARALFPLGRGGRGRGNGESAPRHTLKADILDDDSWDEVIDIR